MLVEVHFPNGSRNFYLLSFALWFYLCTLFFYLNRLLKMPVVALGGLYREDEICDVNSSRDESYENFKLS